MLERYDQSELLSLIEGELSDRSAAALHARLESDPQVASMVQAMMRDRESLRSAGVPELPRDFLAELEPMLSRPMLYESVADAAVSRPGEYRRKHHRQARRMRAMRFAAAAALILAATGGGFALVQSLRNAWSLRAGDLHARSTSSEREAESGASGAASRTTGREKASAPDGLAEITRSELGSGPVHHDRPPRHAVSNSMLAVTSLPPASRDDSIGPASSEPIVLAADFAVVIQSPTATVAESAVSGAIADLGDRAALVRNFSYVEAQKINEEYRVAHGGEARLGGDNQAGSDAQPLVAMAPAAPGMSEVREATVARSELRTLAQRVREQMHAGSSTWSSTAEGHNRASGADATTIAGAASLAPTLERQLDFSSRGANLTLAVPASEVVSLLERLALQDAPGNTVIMLRMLPNSLADSALGKDAAVESKRGAKPQTAQGSQPTLEWLTEGPLVRQAMQRLSQARGDALVLVPVVIK